MSLPNTKTAQKLGHGEYIERAKILVKNTYGDSPKACVITFGCQQNVSDSERIKGLLAMMGYSFTEDPSIADFVLFNTCAVREHAEDRVYGNVGSIKKYKKERPNMLLCVAGCMSQQEKVSERFRTSYPYVDIVLGTQVSHRLPEFIYNRLSGSKRIFERTLDNAPIVEDIPVERDNNIRGFLPVMYGCDNFCSYCIVPYVRGRERSRASAEILKEAECLINNGFKEIMLLGQNVNSYGKGLKEDINFAKLLRKINLIDGDFRIRFMTSHPKDCTDELLQAMADCEKVERHLHLPFQSGSDRVLDEMNRRYTREQYLTLIKKARELMPDITFTSDIIVGFPGETYEDFKQTLSLVSEVKFSQLFTFIYSARTGTPAASMPDIISREEKGVWFDELLALQDEISHQNNKALIGKTFKLLIDEYLEEKDILIGKTSGGLSVEIKGDKSLLGSFKTAKITDYTNTLKGVLIEN